MSLISKIFEATQSGHLRQPFTVEDLKSWMTRMNIVKDDGEKYAQSSIDAILSNSDTKNKNKWGQTRYLCLAASQDP